MINTDFKALRDCLDKICNVDGLPVRECRVIHKGEVVFDHKAGKATVNGYDVV